MGRLGALFVIALAAFGLACTQDGSGVEGSGTGGTAPPPGGSAGTGSGAAGTSGGAGDGGGGTTGNAPGASGAAGAGGTGALDRDAGSPGAAGATSDAGPAPDAATATSWQPSCPAGFTPKAGLNAGFVSDGKARQFHLLLPTDTSTPRPVFVALTGTVQPEMDFVRQSRLDRLTQSGWIVVAPVRTCSQEMRNCNTAGSGGTNDGRPWEPWYDVRGTNGNDDAGPDVRMIIAAVKCVATQHQVDQRRIFHGGISAGGSMANHLLFFSSDFFAGGVPASGVMYGGRVAPRTPIPMQPQIAIVIWGGPTDKWPLDNPIADYAPETKAAAMQFAAQPNVVTLACSGAHGHAWPAAMTPWAGDDAALASEGQRQGRLPPDPSAHRPRLRPGSLHRSLRGASWSNGSRCSGSPPSLRSVAGAPARSKGRSAEGRAIR
jgi:dienelactone hydrolase